MGTYPSFSGASATNKALKVAKSFVKVESWKVAKPPNCSRSPGFLFLLQGQLKIGSRNRRDFSMQVHDNIIFITIKLILERDIQCASLSFAVLFYNVKCY